MSAFHTDTALFCIFHNQHRYLNDGKPCSHIFSGVVQANNGVLDLAIQDFDGSDRTINTELSSKQFNLAALVPISRKSSDAIQKMVGKLNQLDALGKWPFYFSIDMALAHKHEVAGVAARAPEGHIDPPIQDQKLHLYQATGARVVSRINCVRMALMNAQMAGVNIKNIAQVNPLSNTGEEVRNAIRVAHRQLQMAKQSAAGEETVMFEDSFVARKKGNDKSEAGFILGSDGLCIIQAERKDFRIGGFCDALARPVQGKPLFNWVAEGRQAKFQQTPMPIPPYLLKAFSFL